MLSSRIGNNDRHKNHHHIVEHREVTMKSSIFNDKTHRNSTSTLHSNENNDINVADSRTPIVIETQKTLFSSNLSRQQSGKNEINSILMTFVLDDAHQLSSMNHNENHRDLRTDKDPTKKK